MVIDDRNIYNNLSNPLRELHSLINLSLSENKENFVKLLGF